MGGFFFEEDHKHWVSATPSILQKHAFTVTIPEVDWKHINVHEVQAILMAFQHWGDIWTKKKVVVHTDSTTAHAGLSKCALHGQANAPLRTLLLLCASKDILIEAIWIESLQNGLADALSRLNYTELANICPHWQTPFNSMLQHPPS